MSILWTWRPRGALDCDHCKFVSWKKLLANTHLKLNWLMSCTVLFWGHLGRDWEIRHNCMPGLQEQQEMSSYSPGSGTRMKVAVTCSSLSGLLWLCGLTFIVFFCLLDLCFQVLLQKCQLNGAQPSCPWAPYCNTFRNSVRWATELPPRKLYTLCELEWPTFDVDWPETQLFDLQTAKRICQVVTGNPGHPDQFPYIKLVLPNPWALSLADMLWQGSFA